MSLILPTFFFGQPLIQQTAAIAVGMGILLSIARLWFIRSLSDDVDAKVAEQHGAAEWNLIERAVGLLMLAGASVLSARIVSQSVFLRWPVIRAARWSHDSAHAVREILVAYNLFDGICDTVLLAVLMLIARLIVGENFKPLRLALRLDGDRAFQGFWQSLFSETSIKALTASSPIICAVLGLYAGRG